MSRINVGKYTHRDYWSDTFKEFVSSVLRLKQYVLPLHTAAWQASAGPIIGMLNEPDPAKKDVLTALWIDGILSQITNVGFTVSGIMLNSLQPDELISVLECDIGRRDGSSVLMGTPGDCRTYRVLHD